MKTIRLDLWREVGPDSEYDVSDEPRPAPTKDEIRQRFVAALGEVPDGDEAALADFVQGCRKIVRLWPPMRRLNTAPFGLGRVAGLRTRRVRRQKEASRRDMPGGGCAISYEMDDAGHAVMEDVLVTAPSATGHILDEAGQPLCGLTSEIEVVVRKPGAKTDGIEVICSPCQKVRATKPWPQHVFPGEDPTGGIERRLVDFEDYARARR